jgi:hypothetical protein
MKMLHCGAISGTIDRTRAPAAPAGGTPAAGATPPVHDLNVPYEATSEEYATPTADMLFPPVSSTKSPPISPLRKSAAISPGSNPLSFVADTASNPDSDTASRDGGRYVQHTHRAL